MLQGAPTVLAQDLSLDVVVGDWVRESSPLTWPDRREEDRLMVNCGDAAASGGSPLCVRSVGAPAAAAGPPAVPASVALRAGMAAPAVVALLAAVCAVLLPI